LDPPTTYFRVSSEILQVRELRTDKNGIRNDAWQHGRTGIGKSFFRVPQCSPTLFRVPHESRLRLWRMPPCGWCAAVAANTAVKAGLTEEEYVGFYTKVLDKHLGFAFHLISDIVLSPAFPTVELGRKREVTFEEITMVEDSPRGICIRIMPESFLRLLWSPDAELPAAVGQVQEIEQAVVVHLPGEKSVGRVIGVVVIHVGLRPVPQRIKFGFFVQLHRNHHSVRHPLRAHIDMVYIRHVCQRTIRIGVDGVVKRLIFRVAMKELLIGGCDLCIKLVLRMSGFDEEVTVFSCGIESGTVICRKRCKCS
jgi:hypothetical protein